MPTHLSSGSASLREAVSLAAALLSGEARFLGLAGRITYTKQPREQPVPSIHPFSRCILIAFTFSCSFANSVCEGTSVDRPPVKRSRLAIQLVLACLLAFPPAADAVPPFTLKDDDVVAFLGGTNCVNLQNAGHLEVCLTVAQPTMQIRFRDFSWEGDTVYRQGTVIERWRQAKFGDLRKQLADHGITKVIAQFGQSESLEGVTRLGPFRRRLRSIDQSAPSRRPTSGTHFANPF